MTVHLPEWLLWAVALAFGVPALVLMLLCAGFGFVIGLALAK